MKRSTHGVRAVENEVVLWSGQFDTNSTSAPDGISNNITSVTRTAAGKYTVVFKDDFPTCLFPDVSLVGAAGYEATITSVDTASNGNVNGCKIEVWATGTSAAATGTVTNDTKANTTTGDYFILNDGQRLYGFELNTTGASASHSIVPTSSSGTLTCDTKANSTDLDYYILNDGQNKAMLWYNVSGSQAAKYSKVGSKATATVTCDKRTLTTNEDYFTVWDGHRNWKIMLDTDASGDSTGTADFVVDISAAADTPAGTSAAVVAILMETTSIPGFTEAFHLTAVDNSGTITLTADFAGYDGNGTNSENCSGSWAVTNATGGTDAFPAEEFSELDISGATTAADVSAIIHTAIAALTEVRITSVDATGSVTLTNDETGSHGNCSQQFSETGSTLMALTDMTGALDADVVADVWTVVDVSSGTTAADLSALIHTAINATDIQITSVDATGSCTLTNDNDGPAGNTQQQLSETGSTLLAITDMTGGSDGDGAAADTTDYRVYMKFLMRNSKLTYR
jgi:hypothetical protein